MGKSEWGGVLISYSRRKTEIVEYFLTIAYVTGK
jgi:hypothetical protein